MSTRSPSRDSQSPASSPENHTTCDPAVADPPSFPQQRWDVTRQQPQPQPQPELQPEPQPTNEDFSDAWDDENDDESIHDWQAEQPGPSREQILEALESIYHQTGHSVDGAAVSQIQAFHSTFPTTCTQATNFQPTYSHLSTQYYKGHISMTTHYRS